MALVGVKTPPEPIVTLPALELTNLCLFVETLASTTASLPPPPPVPTLTVKLLLAILSTPNVTPDAGSVVLGYG